MLDLKSQFIAWLDTKPADETYDSMSIAEDDCQGCAITQFLNSLGMPCGCALWHKMHFTDVGDAVFTKPYTFGALRARLEQAV